MITAGISGSTGALDITDSGTTDINGDLAMSGTGTITLDAASLGADVTTVGGAIDFSGAVTGLGQKCDSGGNGSRRRRCYLWIDAYLTVEETMILPLRREPERLP